MLVILVLIGVGIYFLTKNNGSINFKQNNNSEAEEILKLRYVKGEIDDETYMRMLKALKN